MSKLQGKKNRKIGRAARKPKNARYINSNRRFRNKLKRVKQSCGEAFAVAWERKYR
jgi:ribosomal protein L19E